MHRFYLTPDCVTGETVNWDKKESHHICRVLRLAPGDVVTAFDGAGLELSVRLETVNPEVVSGHILRRTPVDREIPVELELVQGVAKADKMDWIIQKNVEVGVTAIQPILTRYTVVKLDEKKRAARHARWESIIREACKQCRRNTLPVLGGVAEWSAFLPALKPERLYILFYEAAATDLPLKTLLRQEQERVFKYGVSILIGPEGGWSEEEVEAARARGIRIASLGRRILRTETAGLVAASIILYEMNALA